MPPSVNALFLNVRGVGRVKTKAYRSWQHEAGWELKAQRPGRILGRYALRIMLSRTKRRSDAANREKALSDLLVTHGIVSDDSLAERVSVEWSDAVDAGRVKLVLEAVP